MGLIHLKTLGHFHCVEKIIEEKMFKPIINNDKLYYEYAIFKRQATTEWLKRDFLDVWNIIDCSKVYREKLLKLLNLSFIGLLQCSSTAAYERGFGRLNAIKNSFGTKLKRDVVDAFICISVEGPELEDYDSMLA